MGGQTSLEMLDGKVHGQPLCCRSSQEELSETKGDSHFEASNVSSPATFTRKEMERRVAKKQGCKGGSDLRIGYAGFGLDGQLREVESSV